MSQSKASTQAEADTIMQALSAPFEPTAVKFKPAVVSGNRALALAYVDARVIQDRLDEVLGVNGWQDDYECLADGSVVCRLRLRLGDEWVTKVDVGSPSEQPDSGDRLKAAFSDALKRAAVKFGLGRYLYRLPQQWVDYDPQRKQFVRTPTLETEVSRPRTNPREAAAAAPRLASHSLPADGTELQRRLYDYDARLAREGMCKPGDLVRYVVREGKAAGYDADLAAWSGDAMKFAVERTRAFENATRRKPSATKDVA